MPRAPVKALLRSGCKLTRHPPAGLLRSNVVPAEELVERVPISDTKARCGFRREAERSGRRTCRYQASSERRPMWHDLRHGDEA